MSTGERATENRVAAIGALTATLNAGLAEDEAVAKAAILSGDGMWTQGVSMFDPSVVRAEDASVAGDDLFIDRGGDNDIGLPHAVHIARHDPARVLRDVKAGRDLLAAILAERHDYNPSDEYYSCSQAEDYDPAPGEGGPGSGCSDPDRAGQPCDCGRDARVERLLRILAGAYEDGARNGEQR